MENIFHREKGKDADTAAQSDGSANSEVVEENAGGFMGTGECLEILYVSYAPKLKSICIGGLQSSSLKNLKCLFLEYCPQVSAISSAPEQLGNLETLQIRFCHKFVALSEHEPAAFPKLHTLKLWALPELKSITCDVSALQTLEIGECPMLEKVFSSTQLPKGLNSLQIKFCDRLKIVFEPTNGTLPSLRRLCLWDLPELEANGADLPELPEKIIRECPKLTSLYYADVMWGKVFERIISCHGGK